MSNNDFWDLVDKYKKKAVEKSYGLTTSTPGITSTRGTTPESAKFWETVEEYQSDSLAEIYSQIAPHPTVRIDDDDIAPTKEEEDEGGLDLFQRSKVFDDGYDFGDISKTILGTAGDVGLGALKGFGKTFEGAADVLGYGMAGAARLFGADEFADNVKEAVKEDTIEDLTKPVSKYLDKASVLGRTSDAISEGIGQIGAVLATGGLGSAAGLSAAGTTALTTGFMGVSGMGSGMGEAYKGGATDEEALAYGAIAGTADALTELIFGGLGKTVKAAGLSVGLSSADDMLAKKVSSMFTNQIAKNFAEFGIKAGAEGFEEVLAGVAQGVGKKLTYMDEEELSAILADENLLEQFVVGAVTSGLYQSGGIPGTRQGSLIEANQTGRDFITGLTQTEQTVVDKEYETRLAEAEKDGKLTGKEKAQLYDRVVEDMDKGYISTDTIEEVLGGETYKSYQDTVKIEEDLIQQEKSLAEESKKLEAMVWEKMTGEQQVRRDELRGMLPEIRQKLADMKKTSSRDQLKTKLGEEVQGLAKGSRLMESYNEAGRRKQAFEANLSQYDAKQQEVIKKAVESGILNNTRRTHEFVDFIAKISADKGVLFDFTNNAKLKESGFAVNGKFVNGYVTKGGVTINIQSTKSLNSVVGHEITHVLEGTEFYNELQSAVTEYAKTKGDYQSRYDALAKLYENVEGADINAELTADLVGDYLFTDSDFIGKLSTEHRNVFQKIFDEVKHLLKLATAGSKEAQQLEKVKRAFEKAYRATKNTADGGVKRSLSDSTGKQLTQGQAEYFKDSEARDDDGRLVKVYHSTHDAGFFEFKGSKNSDSYLFGEYGKSVTYFTDNKQMADSYAPDNTTVDTRKRGKVVDTARSLAFDVKSKLGIKKSGQYEGYVNITNPYVVDAQGRDWNAIDTTLAEADFNTYMTITPEEKDAVRKYFKGEVDEDYEGQLYAIALYEAGASKPRTDAEKRALDRELKSNRWETTQAEFKDLFVSALKKLGSDSAVIAAVRNDFSAEGMKDFYTRMRNTNDIVLDALKLGTYDGVIIKNVVNYGSYADASDLPPGNLYVTFNPEQFKAADNQNPTSDTDIRYSLSESVEETNGERESPKSYAEIVEEQQSLYQREISLRERKQAAVNNPELLQAMDDYAALFDEMRSLLPKRKNGTATKEELNRIEEIKALREERMMRVAELQESLGLKAISEEEAEIRETKETLRKAADAAWAREGTEKENKAIEKAGVPAAEYFRKKALKAFKTTTNFNEAGYMLPDGKLLNFSGGERNHRYRDHREIGEIYEATQGVAALNRFLNDGNIRIMAESPGIDLASGVEPTKEQYAALRRFVNANGVADGKFFVDFSGVNGERVGKYEYTGRVLADRIINDIKYFYQNGKVRESSGLLDFLSLSYPDEAPTRYGDYNVYGEDVALETDEIAPVAESAADNTQENAALVEENDTIAAEDSVEDLFPDDTAPLQEEYEQLVAQRDDLMDAMNIFAAVDDIANAERMMNELGAVQERIDEIEADESDRLASISEADEPVTMDSRPEDVADNVPLTKTMVAELAKDVRSRLGLPAKKVAEVRDLIARYSTAEFPSRAHLYAEIHDRFGTYTESYVDEDLKGVKALLRTYGISVDDSIKRDIADYGQLMRSNFGKVRFSKDGLPVDVAYMEFQEVMPGLFPERIDVPADQLLRIIEVANMDVASEQTQPIESETLEEVTNLIANRVTEFKQARKETLANKHGRESFQSLMEDADQYVPPVKPNTSAPARTEMTARAEDIAPVFDTTSGQQALMPEPEPAAEEPKAITRKQLHENIVDDITATFREKGYEFTEVLKKAKDLSTFATVDNTPQRVMEKALGYKEGRILADMTVNKVAQNETEGIRWLNSFTDKKSGLLAKISKQYGIKPGSKQSAAAQMYAEGFYVGENDAIIAYGDAELAKDFPNAKVQENIKKLARDPRIRMIYDETLAAINESRSRNAYPEIPRLDNYFLHFRAMEDTFSRLGLPFNPNDIRAKDLPTDLNGVTADLKPGQPYFASAMHRKGKRTSFDLLGGLEKYLTSAKNQIYHIDDIQTLRALRNYVAETYGQAHGLENLDTMSNEEAEQRIEDVYKSHLSTFAKFLNEEANVLAGKTSLIDRGLEGVIGRRGMTFLDTLNRQVGANMVGFNVSSSLTNFLAPVQAFAKTNKFDFVKAMAQTAANKIGSVVGRGDSFVEDSPVMIRRKGAERFYRTPWEKVADKGYIFMSMVDDLSTEIIARTKYNEFTRKGMDSQQAHIETDKWVSRLMGDRSLGQQPQLYNSKTLGLITKFQLEVRNQLDSQFYDTIQEAKVSTEQIENKLLRNAKKAAKITSTFAQLAVMQHLFGKAFESIAGYNPAFDIIEVLIKTMGWDDDEEDEDTVLDNIEQGFLALLGDLPYTSTLTGGRIPIASALPVTELIKGEDQYGNEKNRWDTIKEAAPYYFLPGGYGQIKKTKAGLEMFDDEHPVAGSYTDSGNLRFPVEDTTWNRVQAGLFGQWASENARDYFDNERKPMREKQIEEFLATGMEIQDYWDYREGLSEYDTLEEKVDYIAGLDLPVGTKNILVNNLTDRKESIDLSNYDEYGGLEEMDFAMKYPDKYEVAEAVGGYQSYMQYQEDMKGMKLAEKADYIAGLNLSTEQKNLLINSETDRKEPIDLTGYENYSSFEEFEFAKKNPEKYALAKAVGGYDSYTVYADALGDITSDKDEWGQSINGSRKPKVYAYIYSLDIPEIEQHILFKSQYPSTDDHNYEIIDYLNQRDDISYDEMVAILLDLDFKVSSDGTIRW